jgi:hypothetical protein
MCLRRAPEKYIAAALDRAGLDSMVSSTFLNPTDLDGDSFTLLLPTNTRD